MARPDKAASVAEITEAFTGSSAAVITEYRGLKVSEMKELRRSLGGSTQYAVVKNTLTKIAAKQAGLELDALLEGPTAIAFIKGDPVEAAKGLRDFAKAHPLLVIKGGVLDAKALTADEIKKLADLESREVLLSKMAGAMKASLQQAVSLFAAPLAQTARLAAALRDKVAAEQPQDQAVPEEPATEAPTETAEAPPETSDAPPVEDATEDADAGDSGSDLNAAEGGAVAEESPEPAADTTDDDTTEG